MITATALEGIPEVRPGDDLASLIVSRLPDQSALTGSEVLVVAHKIVSKSEGRVLDLKNVQPTNEALQIGKEQDKDARHVQVVLDETRQLLRAVHGVLICVTRHGYVCANAGVDASNVPGEETVVMLPEDPDASARRLRARLQEELGVKPAVIITDSFGRAWRHGQVDISIGVAGLAPAEDWRGQTDAHGRELKATLIAVADELAAAADLARSKDGYQPVVVIEGAGRHVTDEDGPGAAALVRPESEDLFR